jgi:hypothetical protein
LIGNVAHSSVYANPKRVLQNIEGFPRYHDFRETPISTKIFGISFGVAD